VLFARVSNVAGFERLVELNHHYSHKRPLQWTEAPVIGAVAVAVALAVCTR
jgi:hypothetical protein